MKAVRLLIESSLPPELRKPDREYSAGDLNDLLVQVAQTHPDSYEKISSMLADYGRNASFTQGETLTLEDLRPVIDKKQIFSFMRKDIAQAKASSKTDEEFNAKRLKIWGDYSDLIEKETQKSALAKNNNIALAVLSGARGKSAQLKTMISTPGIYADSKGRPVPLFIENSHSDGLRPYEYLASTYGARSTVISTKNSTAKGGDFAKQMVSITAPLVVTNKKSPTDNGIDLDINDDSLKYRVLSKQTAGYPPGTLITSRVLSDIRKSDTKYVMVYSPLTDTSEEGISAESVGGLNGGRLYNLGSAAGITSSQAIGEPITQMALNAKHCLLEGTQVRMADFSIKNIENINPGELVLGADINGRTFPVKVKAVWDQGIQPVYRYAYRMGQTTQLLTLESTDCHQILSNTKKSSCKEASLNTTLRKLPAGYKGKNVAAVLPTSYDDSGKMETNIALLLGVFLGDGIRTTRDSAAKISCADNQMIEDLSSYCEPLNIKFVKRARSHDWGVVLIQDDISGFRESNGTVTAKVRNPLKQVLEKYNLLGKYAHEKRIPAEAIKTWDNKSIAALIAGFIATDGSVYSNKEGQLGLSFSSSSVGLLEDLKLILMLRLGIPSTSITRTNKAGEGNRLHDQWQFTVTRISELKKLRNLLPPIPGVKEKRFNTLLAKASYSRNDSFYRCKRVDSEFLGNKQCWDISVDHEDELFVLANGLIVKNTGGVAGKKKTFAGFNTINQFVQSPEAFANKATVSELDGLVEKIEAAPQGGNYVWVNGQEHYTPPGYDVMVKVGDNVEPGDALSDGIADPRDIVRLRGLGEGRKYYATRLKTILDDSGIKTDRKHTEMVARAALDHLVVTSTDGLGNYLPDDEISYNAMASSYVPPKDTIKVDPTKSVGKYLQAPALHYTIGTKLTKRMAQHLADREIKDVLVSDLEPGFAPSMTRLRTAAHSMPDWLAKMQTSYLGKNLQESAVRGEDTNIETNVHFAPRLAVGAGFGAKSEQTGKF